MSSKCGRISGAMSLPSLLVASAEMVVAVSSAMPSPLVFTLLLLLHSELVDVDVSGAETVRATRQVAQVSVVHLFGLKRDRLILPQLQRLRPAVERPRIVRLQRLRAGHGESSFRRTLFDHLDGRQLPPR